MTEPSTGRHPYLLFTSNLGSTSTVQSRKDVIIIGRPNPTDSDGVSIGMQANVC